MAWPLLISLRPVSTEKEQAEQKKTKLHSLEKKGTPGNGRLQPGLLAEAAIIKEIGSTKKERPALHRNKGTASPGQDPI